MEIETHAALNGNDEDEACHALIIFNRKVR